MYYPEAVQQDHANIEGSHVGLPTPNLHEPSNEQDWKWTMECITDFCKESVLNPLGVIHAVIDYFYDDAGEPEYTAVFGQSGSVLLRCNYGVEVDFTPVEIHKYITPSEGE